MVLCSLVFAFDKVSVPWFHSAVCTAGIVVLLWCDSGVLYACSGVHDATFSTRIPLRHTPEQDEQYRFTLYDCDHDDRIADDEIVGEVWVSARQLVGGQQVQLPVKKNGAVVPEVQLVFNSTAVPTVGVRKPLQLYATTFTTFEVAVSCVGFPLLSRHDAIVCASMRDPRTNKFMLFGQTERVK